MLLALKLFQFLSIANLVSLDLSFQVPMHLELQVDFFLIHYFQFFDSLVVIVFHVFEELIHIAFQFYFLRFQFFISADPLANFLFSLFLFYSLFLLIQIYILADFNLHFILQVLDIIRQSFVLPSILFNFLEITKIKKKTLSSTSMRFDKEGSIKLGY